MAGPWLEVFAQGIWKNPWDLPISGVFYYVFGLALGIAGSLGKQSLEPCVKLSVVPLRSRDHLFVVARMVRACQSCHCCWP